MAELAAAAPSRGWISNVFKCCLLGHFDCMHKIRGIAFNLNTRRQTWIPRTFRRSGTASRREDAGNQCADLVAAGLDGNLSAHDGGTETHDLESDPILGFPVER